MSDETPQVERATGVALLPGIILAGVLVIGLASGVIALTSTRGEAVLDNASIADVADGKTTAKLSTLLNDEMLGGSALALAAKSTDWLMVGDLGPGVRKGCDGWLFLNDELRPHPHPEQAIARRADVVARVADGLRAKSIQLLVVVAPDKSRIEGQALCGLPRGAAQDARLAAFQDQLTARGVDTVDLAPVLSALDGERYFRTDTHWNERGARAAAQAIADHLKAGSKAPEATGEATLVPGETRERVGDLIHLAGLSDAPAWARPKGDMAAETTITQPGLGGDDLLGDVGGPPVVVIGSSYSRNANFIGFLSAAMAVPVGDMARDGAGFDGAARAYFSNAAFRETPPQILVWEIPERVLDAPAGPDEAAWTGELQ